ncbi:MAG: glycosyltransferase [Thermodesulfobacteriota bacterium]
MLEKIHMGHFCCAFSTQVDNFRPLVGDDLIDELLDLARDLKDIKICHINATPFGGGVAELLTRQIPILVAMGLQAEWRIIHGDQEFFTITKSFHNAMQGQDFRLTEDIKAVYNRQNQHSAALLGQEYDVVIIHDPQPAALPYFTEKRSGKWIWRCHIDSSEPNLETWAFLKPYIETYDAAVFTLENFVPPDLRLGRVEIIRPAIDPFSSKNMALPPEVCRNTVANSGVDMRRPFILQVSRFDPWKDPLGVIQAYRLVKEEISEVQLVLIGAMAGDDPEGYRILSQVNEESSKDVDTYVFTNLAGVGNMEVNAFQRSAQVVLQKSIKEGFGLVVSESLWKETPVVAGKVGGIPLQVPEGMHDYLVSSVEECAEKILSLLRDETERKEYGKEGKELVRRKFLTPRLIRDELSLIRSLVSP